MAVTDAPATLSELRTDFLNRVRTVTGVTATNNIADRYLNIALQDLHLHRQWWWQERRAILVTRSPYTTGTVTVSEGATAVTGSSTAWTTANNFGVNNARVGDKITLGATTDVYVISAVGSATSITLETRYTGAALSASGYAVFQDEYALESDFGSPLDWRIFSEERKIRLVGPKEFYRLYPRNSVRRTPKHAALIELGPSGSTALRRRVVFGPAPDNEYSIPYRFATTNLAVSSGGTGAATMSADTDVPIVPTRYRYMIVLNAIYHWYRDRKDDARSQEAKAEYEGLIMRMTQDAAPEAMDHLRFVPEVVGFGAGRGRGSRRRFSTDDSWDQLRW